MIKRFLFIIVYFIFINNLQGTWGFHDPSNHGNSSSDSQYHLTMTFFPFWM